MSQNNHQFDLIKCQRCYVRLVESQYVCDLCSRIVCTKCGRHDTLQSLSMYSYYWEEECWGKRPINYPKDKR